MMPRMGATVPAPTRGTFVTRVAPVPRVSAGYGPVKLRSVPMSTQSVLAGHGLDSAPAFADVVVIVRVFNEAPVVGSVIRELREAGLAVLAVDDASTDSSADEIDAAGAFRVGHPANLGAGGALQTGIEAALAFTDAEYIACFDADGQHRVQDLLGMIALIRDGHDVVFGSRFLDGGATEMPWLRRRLLRAAT